MSATARSVTIRRAAPPADALYSRASPGAPWLVSEPIASPYFIIFESVRPIVVWIAAGPALPPKPKAPPVRNRGRSIPSPPGGRDGLAASGVDLGPQRNGPAPRGG